jgi:cathepsin B
MGNLHNIIGISIIISIVSHISNKIDKDYLENLKETSQFEILDYEKHPFKDWSLEELKTLTSRTDYTNYEEVSYEDDNTFLFLEGNVVRIPRTYDIRQVYPECVKPIRHQLRCQSCWAHVAANMLSYKLCIGTKEKLKVILSPQDLVSCNLENNGCEPSKANIAWDYLINEGIVTEECLPYTSANGVRGECPFIDGNLVCKSGTYKKYKAKEWYRPKTIGLFQESIIKDGPVHALMEVYQDFTSYMGGVYIRDPESEYVGVHSVMIIGWGVDEGSSTRYWIGVNSWGSYWGENGFFKIAFKQCRIENGMWTGTANFDDI